MPSQGYERVAAQDDHDDDHLVSPTAAAPQQWPPASPPPSFRSRTSSPHATSRLIRSSLENNDATAATAASYDDDVAPLQHADRTLADTFDSDSDDDEDGDGRDDRQRLMRGNPQPAEDDVPTPGIQRRLTELPAFNAQAPSATGRVYGGGNGGVWANLSAKPTRGEDAEEKPPTYEQAAADATPPYWETTILAPGTFGDEVFVEGLPVGSLFSFVWNAMISMSFQLVGFLLTYLLHTTHAAKNGSRAGLGITLVQFGFGFRSAVLTPGNGSGSNDNPGQGFDGSVPSDPNAHDFDADSVGSATAGAAGDVASSSSAITGSDWIAYGLMIVGWFILIKSVSDFIRARRHEQLVLQSPDRGLGVAVVAEGEDPERSV